MMKKLLLFATVLFTMSFQMRSQTPATSTFVVTDTLHYYLNKYYFKSGAGQGNNSVPVIKLAASTVTGVTHVGVIFENCDTLDVNGIEGIVAKTIRTSQQSIRVRMYLCNLNSSRLPVLPPIDSTADIIIGSANFNMMGGSLIHGPKRVTTDYAICFRNMSTIAGDTILLGRTASKTMTATNASWSEKYSEGNGVMRFGGNFRTVTNFTALGLGNQTDYEFILAPRVTYTIQASQAMPQPVIDSQTLCTSTPVNFTNTSSCRISHRMYNLIEFYNFWNLRPGQSGMANTPAGGWSADSSIVWKFDNEDNLATGGRIFLHKYNNNVISFQSDSVLSPICSDQNFFRMRLRTSGIYGRGTMYTANQQFTICLDYCNGDAVGLQNVTNYPSLNLYPNPTNGSGITTINGLSGKNTIKVYDILGQLVSTVITADNTATIDLSNKANGNYIVRISNDSNMSKTVRLIKGAE